MKKILTNKSAHAKILSGAQKLCDIVGLTLGPRGRNVVIERENGTPIITNDGVTIAREVIFADKYENMSAQVLLQASSQTNIEAGDGTTSAIVLATEILKKGFDAIDKGASPVLLKQELICAGEMACDAVGAVSRPVTTSDEILAVASNSCASETDGKLVACAFEKVGQNGVVSLEENGESQTYLKHVSGCEISATLASPYMIENPKSMQTEYENVRLVVINDTIKKASEIVPILEYAGREKEKVVIVANDFSQEVINLVLLNRVRAGVKLLLVKITEMGERRNAIMEDICALTGATLISQENDLSLEKVGNVISTEVEKSSKQSEAYVFGTCIKITCGLESCTIIINENSTERLNERIELIKSQIESATDEYSKTRLKERLAKLTGGIAIISVGAPTDIELKERKLRIEDAVNAVRSAMTDGIVAGGGIAYAVISGKLIMKSGGKINDGAKVLASSLDSIIKRILENAGEDSEKILLKIRESDEENFGYDALNRKFCNMVESNIVDPAKVIKQVIRNAVSVASTLLTTEGMIVSEKLN